MGYEEDRFRLAARAHEVLGESEGVTLMEHLPHGGWSNFATKDDLRVLSAELRREIADSARSQTISLLGLLVAMMTVQTTVLTWLVG